MEAILQSTLRCFGRSGAAAVSQVSSMATRRLRSVTTLVDWDAARRIAPPPKNPRRQESPELIAFKSFEVIRNAIATVLSATKEDCSFSVSWRVYHGWYSGRSKTADRREFERFAARWTSYKTTNIAFTTNMTFGDELGHVLSFL